MPNVQKQKRLVTKAQKRHIEQATDALLQAGVHLTNAYSPKNCDGLVRVVLEGENRFILETAFKLQKLLL
jgi:hypothetical protein